MPRPAEYENLIKTKPPVSKAEAATMLAILAKYLPVAHTLTGTP